MCSEAECQRERHRRSCAQWRRNNAREEQAERLRRRLREPPPPGTPSLLGELRLEVVRDVVGPEAAVIIEETAELLNTRLRDAVAAQGHEITGKSPPLRKQPVKDAIALGRGPP